MDSAHGHAGMHGTRWQRGVMKICRLFLLNVAQATRWYSTKPIRNTEHVSRSTYNHIQCVLPPRSTLLPYRLQPTRYSSSLLHAYELIEHTASHRTRHSSLQPCPWLFHEVPSADSLALPLPEKIETCKQKPPKTPGPSAEKGAVALVATGTSERSLVSRPRGHKSQRTNATWAASTAESSSGERSTEPTFSGRESSMPASAPVLARSSSWCARSYICHISSGVK